VGGDKDGRPAGGRRYSESACRWRPSSAHSPANIPNTPNNAQGTITDMREEKVVQPLLVTSSALTLATECVRMILKVRARGCGGAVGAEAG
jgi:hypothetical protein